MDNYDEKNTMYIYLYMNEMIVIEMIVSIYIYT